MVSSRLEFIFPYFDSLKEVLNYSLSKTTNTEIKMGKSKRIAKKRGGGWPAVVYSMKLAKKAGPLKLLKAIRKSNVCKTCAFGMKGARNELGEGLQICKKGMQAITQDLMPGIPKEFWETHPIDLLKTYSGKELEGLGRLIHPLYRKIGDEYFTSISWDDAFEKIFDQFRNVTSDKTFFYTSGRSSNEAAFLTQLLARQYGANNVNNCSFYCHQATGVGLSQTFGSGTSTVELEDVDKSDLVVLIGANPSSNHPRFMTHLMNLRKRKGSVLIINPFKEVGLEKFAIPSKVRSLLFTSDIASDYFQPHCGGDMSFLKAATAKIWIDGFGNKEFMEKHCNNFEEWLADIETTDIAKLLTQAGLTEDELDVFCEYLINANNVIFTWAMGLTHQIHGVETIRILANLALMLGMIGKEGAGLLPLRGHSNVQGVGTVGVVPKLKPKMVDALAEHLQVTVPDQPGLDTFASIEAAERGEIDFALLLGGNLYGSNPNLNRAGQALNNINFTLQISTTFNLGHIFGQGKECLILPVRTRDEETQITTQESMFNFVRYSVGGSKSPAEDLPTETEIIGNIGRTIFPDGSISWTDMANHDSIREVISNVVPGLKEIISVTEKEFTVPGRVYHEPEFNTPNKKANLGVFSPPDTSPKTGHFNLTTFRSEGQFNTIIYDEEDIYRGTNHRNVVFISQVDLDQMEIESGNQVIVKSEIGEMKVEAVSARIRPGNLAMFYPEANQIVPAKLDPKSRTPSFKRITVSLKKN
ncbi:MAG: FdhF/YdeP family oxidoreductase [Candidatus Heimdallarchaeota archaeon]|nr:FdhF/YdeP family oxidoreductase [Candidatus Heimdallarchaeota archaeon]